MSDLRFAGDAFTRPGEIASVHDMLDSRQTGVINDGIDRHFIHQGGESFSAPMKGAGNPLPNEPEGSQRLQQMGRDRFDEMENIHRNLMQEQIFGPPGMA